MGLSETVWGITSAVGAVSVGAAFAIVLVGSAVTPGEVRFARLCFIVPAILLAGVEVWWVVITDAPLWWRALTGLAVGAVVFIGLPEGLRWISHRQSLTPATLGAAKDTKPESPAQPLHGALPGVGVWAVVEVQPLNNLKRKYIFELETDDHEAMASLYMTPDNHLTLSVTDVGGETYPVEVPLGQGGVPMGSMAVIAAEVGVASNYSILQVSINGTIVQSRKIDFPIDLGSKNFTEVVLGRGVKRADYGRFNFLSFVQLDSMPSESDAAKLNEYFMTAFINRVAGPVVGASKSASPVPASLAIAAGPVADALDIAA